MRYCTTGKVCYSTPFQAEEALIHAIVRTGSTNESPNGIYRCEYCECYHLTSSSRDRELIDSPQFQQRLRNYRQASEWEDRF